MSDSDDDMPPPLEDMTSQVQAMQAKKQAASSTQQSKASVKQTAPVTASAAQAEEDDEGWTRIAPSKPQAASSAASKPQAPAQTKSAKTLISEVPSSAASTAQPSAAPSQTQQKKKNSGGFGGFKKGFLFGGPAKKAAAKPSAAAAPPKPKVEDHTHVKAKPKEENLRFDSVQESLKTGLERNKQEWLTPQLMEKIAKSPRLQAAFKDPGTMKILTEMGNHPDETIKKYGDNPNFRELLKEWSELMGGHFQEIGEKKMAEEKKKMEDDPAMKAINHDPQVQAIMRDPKVMAVIQTLQRTGGLDFHAVAQRDQETAQKLMVLIQKGVLNTQTTMPSGGMLP